MRVVRDRKTLHTVPVAFHADLPWALFSLPLPLTNAEWRQIMHILEVLSPAFIDEKAVTALEGLGPPAPFAYKGFHAA